MATDERSPDDGAPPWWAGSTLAAALTAVATVLVAVSAFLSAQAASNSADDYAAANRALTDANFFFGQGVDSLAEEFRNDDIVVDRICLLELVTDAADGECGGDGGLDPSLADDPVLVAGFAAQAEADQKAATGLSESTRSVEVQAALVLFAVGLALSAWAALAETGQRARLVFLVVAVAAVAAGSVRLVTV